MEKPTNSTNKFIADINARIIHLLGLLCVVASNFSIIFLDRRFKAFASIAVIEDYYVQ